MTSVWCQHMENNSKYKPRRSIIVRHVLSALLMLRDAHYEHTPRAARDEDWWRWRESLEDAADTLRELNVRYGYR